MKTNVNNVIPNYSDIQFKHSSSIKGFTQGISIRGEKMDEIEYHVVFWVGAERKEVWVRDREIELIPEKEPIGFNKPNDQMLLR